MNVEYQQVTLRNEIHRDLRLLSHRWEELISYRNDRNDRISLARGVELLIAHAKSTPPTPEFIEEFKFRTPRPGRPRRLGIDSPAQPTVSEEQLSDTELNELRDGGGRLIQKEDETEGDWCIRLCNDDVWDNPRARESWDAWRRRDASISPEAPDEGEPLSGDGQRGG